MKTGLKNIELSVVVPVYNSADIFPELYKRLVAVLEKITGSFEIIAIVDGCRDSSFDVISELNARDKRVKVVDFARNFGHQAAVSAGLALAHGNMVAVIDDDLEDPPELLETFKAKLDEGFDVVYGIRKTRKRSWLYRIMFGAFYRVLGFLSDVRIPYDAGDFCMMKRPVVDVLNAMPESNRYMRGLRAWVGFSQTGVEYDRAKRFANQPGYSLRKYFALAFDAIFSFSYKPLGYMSRLGLLIAVISFFVGFRLVVNVMLGNTVDVPGWASLFVAVLFLSGIQLVCMGILGQYIMRIYDEVKKRPIYVVKRLVGMDETENHQ